MRGSTGAFKKRAQALHFLIQRLLGQLPGRSVSASAYTEGKNSGERPGSWDRAHECISLDCHPVA